MAVIEYLKRIEEMGGALVALESGWLGAELEREAFQQQQAIETSEKVVVGVNRFASEARPGFEEVLARNPCWRETLVWKGIRLGAYRRYGGVAMGTKSTSY